MMGNQEMVVRLAVVVSVSLMLAIPLAPGAEEAEGAGTEEGYYLGPQIHGPDNQDRLTNKVMNTLPLEDVVKDQWTDGGGQYPPSRLISTISPVVVRQNDPTGPKYQEALGYSFLINAPKYPGLCRMDDGTLVLTLTAALAEGSAVGPGSEAKRTDVILYSTDDGMSWSQPRRIPFAFRTTPMNLGGKRLLLRGHANNEEGPWGFWFSNDAGQTWSEQEKRPLLPDGSWAGTDVPYNFPIEGDTIRFMFHYGGKPIREDRASTVLRPYNFRTHTWGEPTFLPRKYRSSEASLTRAKNGNLVACLRTGRPGIPWPFDGWRGIVTIWSADDGKTWSEPAVHSLYGHVHHSFVTFTDGRILMTYAARIGELDSTTYHGLEAVLSYDHGKTWDWEHRYILFRALNVAQHSPQSVLLSDGRILSIMMHAINFTWKDSQAKGNVIYLSNVSVVIWSPG